MMDLMRQAPKAAVVSLPAVIAEEPPIRAYIVQSKIVIAVLFGGFGLWAASAPLTSAAVAPGVVKVDSYRKTLQHLEGGIVSEILVHEGDAVVQGQPLVRLDDADAEADLKAVGGQIGALEAETTAVKEQLPSLEEQLADERSLFQKGYAKKSQIFELERTVVKMKGDVEANESRLTSLREQQAKAQAKTARNVVTAPQDGVVMNSSHSHTRRCGRARRRHTRLGPKPRQTRA